jgi:hypothetical protein
MTGPTSIDEKKRAPQLQHFVFAQAEILSRIKLIPQKIVPDAIITPFLYLLYPWLDGIQVAENQELLAARRQQFKEVGFDGENIRKELESILKDDYHLRECCALVGPLAHCLDLGFINTASSLLNAKAPKTNLDTLYQGFTSAIYDQGPFKAISLCHIFNFNPEQPSLRFGDIRIERLDSQTISNILGETSGASFLHSTQAGNHFIISEREGPCDDPIGWLIEEKSRATLFTHVLQYFKDGIVHIDYAMPHFTPQWVNQIRKWGIFFIGNPRRVPYAGMKPYSVNQDEIQVISRWWKLYQTLEIMGRISDLKHSLRQAGLRAGEYYETNHTLDSPPGRLISLAIALESLFSPNDKGEFTFRISQSVSQLIGSTTEERTAIFKDTKNFYARRSALVHGQYDVNAYLQNNFVTHADCDRWASLIRRAIMAVLVLYLRGRNSRDEFLNELSLAALNDEVAKKIRDESDPMKYLSELEVQGQLQV